MILQLSFDFENAWHHGRQVDCVQNHNALVTLHEVIFPMFCARKRSLARISLHRYDYTRTAVKLLKMRNFPAIVSLD
jgi:hypothetical protein